MATKNKAYKRNLGRFESLLDSTGFDRVKTGLVYSIMSGSYRKGEGRGSRTYNGTRVDCYEGRIKAVRDILGLNDSRYFHSLEKVLATNDYLRATRSKRTDNEGDYRLNRVNSYVRGLYQEAESVKEVSVQDTKSNKIIFRTDLRKGLLSAAASLMVLAGGVLGCFRYSNHSTVPVNPQANIEEKLSSPHPNIELIEQQDAEDSPTNITPSIVTEPVNLQVLEVDSTQIPSNVGNSIDKTPSIVTEPVNLQVLEVDSTQIPSNAETNNSYRAHVDFRNFQSRDSDGDSLDDKVSMNPVYIGKALRNEFVSFGEGVIEGDLGHTEGKTKTRLDSLGRAVVSPLDSLLGVVSGGRLGLHEDTRDSRSQDNLVLGSIRSLYDGVQSIVKGVVAAPDLVLGGLTEKVVYDIGLGGVKTLVNSTVDLGNFGFAVPLDATQRFENWAFKNKGKVSMEIYEAASTIMRFGGNVVLHEAPFNGKYVEVIDESGNKVLINKGETGATLESLMAVLLDAGVLSPLNSSGGNTSKGGSWTSDGSSGGDLGSFVSSGSGGGI